MVGTALVGWRHERARTKGRADPEENTVTDLRNPEVVPVPGGFEHTGKGQVVEQEQSQFFECYEIIGAWTMDTVRDQLWKIGWPYERIAVRVLDWESAVTRLKDDAQSMCCMTRMFVAIEDISGNLYLVRTPDLVTGIKNVHRQLNPDAVQAAVGAAFKI